MNPTTDDTLNLPDVGCCGAVSTPRCWLAMEGSLVINKKKFIMIPITKFGILLNQEGNWLT